MDFKIEVRSGINQIEMIARFPANSKMEALERFPEYCKLVLSSCPDAMFIDMNHEYVEDGEECSKNFVNYSTI